MADKPRLLYQGEDIMVNGRPIAEILTDILECQKKMSSRIEGFEGHIEKHLITHINTAFAGGDPDGHRRAHEAMSNMIEEKRRLRVAIQEKTISGLLWAAIVYGGVSMFAEFKRILGL